MSISDLSTWLEEKSSRQFPSLQKSIDVDVAIIGGGITGITAAYLLRQSGKSVVLLDGGRIGQWATGYTTGFLMEVLDTDPEQLIKQYGLYDAKAIVRAHREAIAEIERIVGNEKIECEFVRCPAFLYGSTEKEVTDLEKQIESFRALGIHASYSADALPLRSSGHVIIENQAKFHPLKYLFALAQKCHESGIQIYEESEVASISQGRNVSLQLKNGVRVHATNALVATHNPFMRPQPLQLRFKKASYSTYVIEALLPVDTLPEALYEDSNVPYHYARIDKSPEHDRIIIGGEDHRSDINVNEDKNFIALEKYLEELLPSVPYTITRKWAGEIVEPGDGIAYIGTLRDKGIYFATGYSGNGLTYSMISAKMFSDHVMGITNPLKGVFAANRPFSLRHHVPKALEYIYEFLMGAVKNTLAPRL